ncbi:MAG: 6-bladed beta-propeller [Gemmatimonadetes bacterium]|nr:6-bladed beta-propeller [Gemmatimonadota bacterium]
MRNTPGVEHMLGIRRSISNTLLILTPALTSCSDVRQATDWAGTIDTLPSGTVVVRNPSQGLWDSTSAWRLRESLRIGAADGDGPEVFGAIGALRIDRLGRIYVLEDQADEIRVFEADGRYVRNIGRRGSGPGELANPIGMDWDADGNLWVVDVGNARYSVFDTTGSYLTQHRRAAGFYALPWPGGFGPDGRFLDTGLDPPDELILVHYDAQMAPADTVRIPRFDSETFVIPQRVAVPVPFAPFVTWRLDRRGYVWSSITADYSVVQQTFGGDTVRIIKAAYDPLPVTTRDKEEALESLDWFVRDGGRIDPSRIPQVKPAIIRQGLLVDPLGYLWVRPEVAEAQRLREFDVFDPKGRYLGRVTSPAPIQSWPLPVVTEHAIYGVFNDELEVPHVVRQEIVRPTTAQR